MSTATQSWTTVDKSGWGPGPWQDEPDKLQWIDEATGLDCLIHRGPLGDLCGYVGVPPGHRLHGVSYQGDGWDDEESPEAMIEVHGGLTFSGRCQEHDDPSKGICHVPEPGRPADVWWLGFDCGHMGDVCPGMEARERSLGIAMPRFGGDVYRDVAYVRAEVTGLAGQLAA